MSTLEVFIAKRPCAYVLKDTCGLSVLDLGFQSESMSDNA